MTLSHAEPGRRVVLVTVEQNNQVLGEALGEAADAELAECRAITRLALRLGWQLPDAATAALDDVVLSGGGPVPVSASGAEASIPAAVTTEVPAPAEAGDARESAAEQTAPGEICDVSIDAAAAAAAVVPAPPATPPAAPLEPQREPSDWSEELAMVGAQLSRIGWDRDAEGIFLERVFGHPSRSRITRYGDLVTYLRALRELEPGSDPCAVPIPVRRAELLARSDLLMTQLGWGTKEGRACLDRHFALSSRQQLDDGQLARFIQHLEQELRVQAQPLAS